MKFAGTLALSAGTLMCRPTFTHAGINGRCLRLGNDNIHWMTSDRRQRLRVDMADAAWVRRFAEYDNFGVGSEGQKYRLNCLGKYQGNAGQCDCVNCFDSDITNPLLRVRLTQEASVAEPSTLEHQKSMERKLEVGSGGLFSLVDAPTILQPGLNLPQQQWSLLNCFRTARGHCGDCKQK